MKNGFLRFGAMGRGDKLVNQTCDLCGAKEYLVLARPSTERCRTVVCSGCSLIYACPQIPQEALDDFYRNFTGDAGSLSHAVNSLPSPEAVKEEEALARTGGLEFVRRFVGQLEARRIIDLRCRTGALSELLIAEGADVWSIDPFEANVNYAKNLRGLSNVFLVPFSRFHELNLSLAGEFEVATALTEHLLGHVLSPRILLSRIFQMLKPGGYLLLDEKDVLLPARWNSRSVFDSGPAHQFHLTRHTLATYLCSSGFELIECVVDNKHVTNFHHFRVAAQKPGGSHTVRVAAKIPGEAPSASQISRTLRARDRDLCISHVRSAVTSISRSVLGRVPGLQKGWRILREAVGRHSTL